jgi:hypothetical protein
MLGRSDGQRECMNVIRASWGHLDVLLRSGELHSLRASKDTAQPQVDPSSNRCAVPEYDDGEENTAAIGKWKKMSSLPAGLHVRAAATDVSNSMGSNHKPPAVARTLP